MLSGTMLKTKTEKKEVEQNLSLKAEILLPHFLSEAAYYGAKDNPLHLRRGLQYGGKTLLTQEKLHFAKIPKVDVIQL